MNKSLLAFFITCCILFLARAPAYAEVVLDDDFINKSLINASQTTAYVDTSQGWVRLPNQPLPNALAMKKFGPGYVVATTTGIKVMEYDEATSSMVANITIPVTDGIGVSVRQDIPRMWVASNTDGSIKQYDLDENAQTYAPGAAVSGLGFILSVSSDSASDRIISLSRSDTGTGIANLIQSKDDGSLAIMLSFDTGVSDPVAVSWIPNTPDFMLASSSDLIYYAYDDNANSYIQDPARSVSGLSGIISVSADGNGFRTLHTTETRYYVPLDSGGLDTIVTLGANPIENSVAISANPNSYDNARLGSDGVVRYYSYDESTGGIVEIPQLSSTGHQLMQRYMAPKTYQSISKATLKSLDTVRLTVQEQNDLNTSISYEISTDGGISWTVITPGIWTSVTEGNNFVVKATLITTDPNNTPRILKVTLEATKLEIDNLIVTNIASPPAGQLTPTNIFPVFVKSGAEIRFSVDTMGFANQVVANFSGGGTVTMTPSIPVTTDNNTWAGTYVIPPGEADGTVFQITITAVSGISGKTTQFTANPFIIVDGTVLDVLQLMLDQ